jgi:hypothetical protein
VSQRFGSGRLLSKPVTRRELLDVLDIFERDFNRKLWVLLPWHRKFWRYLRGKLNPKRRKDRPTQGGVARGQAVQQETGGGDRANALGTPGSNGKPK